VTHGFWVVLTTSTFFDCNPLTPFDEIIGVLPGFLCSQPLVIRKGPNGTFRTSTCEIICVLTQCSNSRAWSLAVNDTGLVLLKGPGVPGI